MREHSADDRFERRLIRVRGTVQGVGFRPFVYRHAVALGLSGSVANDSEGVLIEAEGPADRLDELCRRLAEEPPPLAHVSSLEASSVVASSLEASPMAVGGDGTGFKIVESRAGGAPAVAVSVDVGVCDDCLAEMEDPADRRFGYPFTNCTNCGPRYTIIRAIPYDRPSTTMAGFEMCSVCDAEYHDPADRRFHAQPNACPDCGPQLRLLSGDGLLLAERAQALEETVEALRAGRIVAIKGLGGYHLAVVAADAAAVAELRRRKHRDDKPFAVMVADLATARSLCRLSTEAEVALTSLRRPIVLAPRHTAALPVADGVAPGLPELGLMLPYTPLHHLLLRRVGAPLVMTSGNASDEPIAHRDDDAIARLGSMVDAILTSDRPIHIRCDDSVLRSRADGGVQMARRSRGYSPEPLSLPGRARRRVLAVGAELKNTVAVARDTSVVASHHIGDLEHLAAYRSFLQAVEHLCHITGTEPEVVAHDRHPEYLSTKFALELDIPTVAVQHHHAHIASCLVDNAHRGPVLGVAFDGLGLGECGSLWGGELLVADLHRFSRVGHLRAVPLPGGDRAAKEPWRMAMAWADAALGPGAAERYGSQVDERWRAVLGLIERPDTPTTSSAGRLFDAVAALLGVRLRTTYEGQAAIELEARAASVDSGEVPRYDAAVDLASDVGMLDPAPLIARVIAERDAGTPVPVIAAGFHHALGRATAELATTLARRHGLGTVALSGGVFQNVLITDVVARACASEGLDVLVHRHVPPNDGGISIGQAAIAAVVD
ncbi:MAG TPA: carbamoyltransferase HypF [Acidimicrobiales bacterium]|nr:carbamoyltransferase HypF [Acidimicrobiales bacterium]